MQKTLIMNKKHISGHIQLSGSQTEINFKLYAKDRKFIKTIEQVLKQYVEDLGYTTTDLRENTGKEKGTLKFNLKKSLSSHYSRKKREQKTNKKRGQKNEKGKIKAESE